MRDPERDLEACALDTAWVRRSFDRAGTTYDAAAVLARAVREILLERLDLTSLEPTVVLDAGAGTGHASRALKRRYPRSQVMALDSSTGMLRTAARLVSWRRPFARICADCERLPLADESVDLVFSNLLLPWCRPDTLFGEFRRVLKARGLLTFTSFGPDTLKELKGAWAAVDDHPRVNPFMDMHDIGDALVRAGLAAPVLDVERYTVSYTAVRGLTDDLKAIGARNALSGRLKGLTSPRRFAAMQTAYEVHRRDGRLPATFEVVFGQAWAPLETRIGTDASVPLEDVKRQLAARRRP